MNKSDAAAAIGKWFDECNEFDFKRHGGPYEVIGPSPTRRQIVYCTKPSLIMRYIGKHSPDMFDDMPFALIGRSSLPSRDEDVDWLGKVMSGYAVLYLGDLDPTDIMVFLWLRDRFRDKSIRYLGLSDSFLSAHNVTPDPRWHLIALKSNEHRAICLLDELGFSLEELVGETCAGILRNGNKLELDAVVLWLVRPQEFIAMLSPREDSID